MWQNDMNRIECLNLDGYDMQMQIIVALSLTGKKQETIDAMAELRDTLDVFDSRREQLQSQIETLHNQLALCLSLYYNFKNQKLKSNTLKQDIGF
jgi:hypothetical protein